MGDPVRLATKIRQLICASREETSQLKPNVPPEEAQQKEPGLLARHRAFELSFKELLELEQGEKIPLSDKSIKPENAGFSEPKCIELVLGSSLRIFDCGTDQFRTREGDKVYLRHQDGAFYETIDGAASLKQELRRFGIHSKLRSVRNLTGLEEYTRWILSAKAEAKRGDTERMQISLEAAILAAKKAGVSISRHFIEEIKRLDSSRS